MDSSARVFASAHSKRWFCFGAELDEARVGGIVGWRGERRRERVHVRARVIRDWKIVGKKYDQHVRVHDVWGDHGVDV